MGFVTDLGIESAVLVNGVDVSELLNKAELTNPQDAVKVTRFDPRRLRRRAHQYIAGLSSSTLSTAGFSSAKLADVKDLLRQAFTPGSGADDVLVGVGGFTPGNLAFAVKSILTKQTGPNVMPDGAIAVGADYQGTASSPGLRAGKALWSPHGSGEIHQDTKFSITASAATGNATVTFYDNTGTSLGTVTVHPGDSTATIKAAIEALAYYNTVNVTGSTNPIAAAGNLALSASGASATASSSESPAAPVDALDADSGNGGWVSATAGTMPQWFTIDLGVSNAAPIKSYEFTYLTDSTPKSWTLKGSNTGAFAGEETLIQTKTNQVFAAVSNITIPVTPTAAFRYYRFDFTAAQTDLGASSDVVGFSQIILNASDVSSGTYAIDVASPGNVAIPAPHTTSTGWTAARTLIGGDATGVNKISSTGPGTAINDIATSATTVSGGLAVVQVVDFDGATPSVTVTIEHAVDSAGSPGSWVTLGTFDAMTAPGVQRLAIAPGTTINPHVRLNVTALSGDVAFAGAWFRYPD